MAWAPGYNILPTFGDAPQPVQVWALSPDGSTVVGNINVDSGGSHAAYWTQAGGVVDLGFLPSGTYSVGQGASRDGSVIVGYGDGIDSTDHAWMWTSGGGMVALPRPVGSTYSYAYGISPDGTVIVGEYGDPDTGNDVACYWLASGGDPVALGLLSGGTFDWTICANTNGSVLAGTGDDASSSRNPFRWTSGGGVVDLGQLFSGQQTAASGISGDGSIVVGWGNTGDGSVTHPFSWTAGGGMVDLGVLSTNPLASGAAYAISEDGTKIVGYTTTDDGMGNLNPSFWMYYTVDGGMHEGTAFQDTGGFYADITWAYGVSSDGKIAAGWGTFPQQTDRTYSGPNGCYWTLSDGHLHYLATPATAGSYSVGYAVSSDGHTIAGYVYDAGDFSQKPAMWVDGALTLLGPFTGVTAATAISGNGDTMTGTVGGGGSVYWTSNDGYSVAHPLPPLAGSGMICGTATTPYTSVVAGDISVSRGLCSDIGEVFGTWPGPGPTPGDNTVLYGHYAGTLDWAQLDGIAWVGAPVGNDFEATVFAPIGSELGSGTAIISTDGTKIVGSSLHDNSPSPTTATGVIWTNGVVNIPLPNSNTPGGVTITGCSSDGLSVLAGWTFDGSTYVPCIWVNGTAQHNLVGGSLPALAVDESGTVVNLQTNIYVDSLSSVSGGLYGHLHTRATVPGYGSPTVTCYAAENGLIAGGYADDGTGHNGAIRWNGTTGDALGVVGATATQVNALSGDGSIAAGAYTKGDGIFRPVYWDGGDTAHLLDNPFPPESFADTGPALVQYASRDGSVGVGYVTPPGNINVGFVYAFPATSTPAPLITTLIPYGP